MSRHSIVTLVCMLIAGAVGGLVVNRAGGQAMSAREGLSPWPAHPEDIVRLLEDRQAFAAGEVKTVYQVPADRWLLVQNIQVQEGNLVLWENDHGVRRPFTSEHLWRGFPISSSVQLGEFLPFHPGSTVELENLDASATAGSWILGGFLAPR